MKKYALFVIYGLMFLLFLFKMFYYREEINYVPDEEAHISYLAYLEENPGTMRICVCVREGLLSAAEYTGMKYMIGPVIWGIRHYIIRSCTWRGE